jgi:protein-arginine kinase activator protein McsA
MECGECQGELDSMKWELLDGHGKSYGYACDKCAEGAFDRYMESRIG